MSAESPIAIEPIAVGAVPALAAIHLDAFPGSESTLLGYRYALAFMGWFARHGDAISLAASRDDIPVGYVLGASPRDLTRLYRRLLPVVIGCALAQPRVCASRAVRAMAAQRARMLLSGAASGGPAPADLVLKTIAVTPALRGGGIGSMLLAAFTAAALRRGAKTLSLSVLERNDGARALYERRGWRASGHRDGEYLEYTIALREPAGLTHSLRP